jgi:ATP-dependent Clp protease ATP-binding subunit ClpC
VGVTWESMSSLSSGVTVALRLAGFEARYGVGAMGPGHLLLALSWISDESLSERFDDPDRRLELAREGEQLRERFAEAGIDPDELRNALRAALSAHAREELLRDGVQDDREGLGQDGHGDDPGGVEAERSDSALTRMIRRASELGERGHVGVIEVLRAILEQPLPSCREVFEVLGVDEPLYAFFPEIPRPTPEPSSDAPDATDLPDGPLESDPDLDLDLDAVERAASADDDTSDPASDDESDARIVERTTRVPRRPRHAVDEARTPLLDRYGRDLTLLAREGSLPPLVGREEEMLSLARVLVRQRKANAVLVGEAGVGKTGIVEGLAARLTASGAPPDLANVRIVELTMSALVAGTKYRGEFEERMEAVLKEARDTPGLILFLDELHTVLGAGAATGATDAASILKPMLARGEIRVIGATTAGEYQRYVEEDPALQRRFAVIWVEEPTRAEAIEILEGIAEHIARHHRVEITADAPTAAVELAMRYLPEQHLPDKAIDLLDQACAAARIPMLTAPSSLDVAEVSVASGAAGASSAAGVSGAAGAAGAHSVADAFGASGIVADAPLSPIRVSRSDLISVVAERARIPVERVALTEAQRLLDLEAHLSRRVIGQQAAVSAVSEAVRASRAGLGDPHRPIGVFLLAGPTGSGKTELAKALAEFLFDDERRLIRVDMSEYQDKYTVSRLLGAPPGYLGHDREGQLSGPLRSHPHSVVLFDEVEKAHPEVLDLFLQILDEGRLTDARGRRVSFTETVVMMTTNLGYERGADGSMGFRAQGSGAQPAPTTGPARIMSELRRVLRPELLGRIGNVVVFDPLPRSALEAVLTKLIARVHDRLADRAVTLELDQSARDLLLNEGTDPRAGARALEQTVERLLVQPLGRELLGGAFPDGSVIHITTTITDAVPSGSPPTLKFLPHG